MGLISYIPGLFVSAVIALFSLYVAGFHASFDSLVISIIFGMLLGNLVGSRELFSRGLEGVTGTLLPVGIALYGLQLSVGSFSPGLLLQILAVSAMLFFPTLLLARVFRLNGNLSLLLASGLAICGASAIAVISPLIKARKEDTSIAILSVVMLGLIGMIFYPLIYDFFPITKTDYHFFAGTTLPMMGQVRVAASAVGAEGLTGAVQIKLLRIALLIALVPVIVLKQYWDTKQASVPWFVVIFVALSLLVNAFPPGLGMQQLVRTAGSFCFAAGLAAVGFSVDFDSIIEEGMSPLGVVMSVWIANLVVIYLFRNIV